MTEAPLVYLDSNLFISALEQSGPVSDGARHLLSSIDNGAIRAASSELTLAEVLVGPFRRADRALSQTYSEIFSSADQFAVCPVTRPVLEEAARIRSIFQKTKLPDAIHLATARLNNCRFFVTGDRGIPDFEIVTRLDLQRDDFVDFIEGLL